MRPSVDAQFAHLDFSPIVRIIRNKIALLGISSATPILPEKKRPLEVRSLINEMGALFGGGAI